VYNRLLSTHKTLSTDLQAATREAISPQTLRLNISGSAALPTPIKQAWTDLSNGNVLLERYGMTEVGMALSGSLAFADRVDGSVGWPLPCVEIRLVDPETNDIIPDNDTNIASSISREGEIQLRGPTIFKEYFRNPAATAKEFVDAVPTDKNQDKWFKTGDIAIRKSVPGAGQNPDAPWARGPMYFILGRLSVDIIKIGGEKVSALEVEREMLSLPEIAEAAVLGLPDEKWGQKIAAVIVLSDVGRRGKIAGEGKTKGKEWGLMDLRRALKKRLAVHKLPVVAKVVDSIPRNAMGKVNKKTLAKALFG
jgi:malonyl-CoA/methylmalonyl-CoA synthetase